MPKKQRKDSHVPDKKGLKEEDSDQKQPKSTRPQTEGSGEDEEENPAELNSLVTRLDEIKAQKTNTGKVRQAKPRKSKPVPVESKLGILYEVSSTRLAKRGIKPRGPEKGFKSFPQNSFKADAVPTNRRGRKELRVYGPSKEAISRKGKFEQVAVREIKSVRENEIKVSPAQLQEVSKGGLEPEEQEEEDVFFSWPSGSPYSSRRPKVIIHRDSGEIPTLDMLKALLRDAYKEVEGGEPNAYNVEFLTNEPRFPEIPGNIVLLDLTGEEWTPSLRDKPRIERTSGYDIVPKLKEVSATMFSGRTGYLVVNIPEIWDKNISTRGFSKELAEQLSAKTSSEKLPSVFRPENKHENSGTFWKAVNRYFGLTTADEAESVEEVEGRVTKYLHREDWCRVALTERQNGPNEQESDEHYFLKAAIVEGLARSTYEIFKRSKEAKIKFDDFFSEHFLEAEDRPIETEEEGGDEVKRVSDIRIKNTKNDWFESGIKSFFSPELNHLDSEVYVEAETGRSEGAYNFRKIREKVEK